MEYDYFIYTTPHVTTGIVFTHPYPLCTIGVDTVEVIYDSATYTSPPQIISNFDLVSGEFNFDTTNETYLGETLTYTIKVKAYT